MWSGLKACLSCRRKRRLTGGQHTVRLGQAKVAEACLPHPSRATDTFLCWLHFWLQIQSQDSLWQQTPPAGILLGLAHASSWSGKKILPPPPLCQATALPGLLSAPAEDGLIQGKPGEGGPGTDSLIMQPSEQVRGSPGGPA